VSEVDALSTFDVQRTLELAVAACGTVRFRVLRWGAVWYLPEPEAAHADHGGVTSPCLGCWACGCGRLAPRFVVAVLLCSEVCGRIVRGVSGTCQVDVDGPAPGDAGLSEACYIHEAPRPRGARPRAHTGLDAPQPRGRRGAGTGPLRLRGVAPVPGRAPRGAHGALHRPSPQRL